MQTDKSNFWQELKQRNVVKVAGVYVVVAWLIIQVASTTFPSFGIPDWAFRFVVILLALCFPIALIITWAIELTPDGIKMSDNKHLASSGLSSEKVEALNKKRNWYAIGFAAAVPTVIFTAIFFLFMHQPTDTPEQNVASESVVEQEQLAIAVLPLMNMSTNEENAFFAGGVHEDILTNLSRINGLKVISRTTAMRYFNSDLSLRDIGMELGARYIVEGSVRRINNHVRITVQLIDATNDTHMWANNYDRELVDVFATQSAVAKEISNSLHLEIQPESVGTLNNMPTFSVKAYDLYMKAQSIIRSEPQDEVGYQKIHDLLQEAVKIDPDFVEAWALLNEILDEMLRMLDAEGWFLKEGEDKETVYVQLTEQSTMALQRAYTLDPENLETLLARSSGIVGEEHLAHLAGQPDAAKYRKQIIDYTIEKHPESALAWYILGFWHIFNGDSSDAKTAFIKALELDPFHAKIVHGSLGYFNGIADQEMVDMLFQRLAQISPEFGKRSGLDKIALFDQHQNYLFEFINTADASALEPMLAYMTSDAIESHDPYDVMTWKYRYDQFRDEPFSNHMLTELSKDINSILSVDYKAAFQNKPMRDYTYFIEALGTLMFYSEILENEDNAVALAERTIELYRYLLTLDDYPDNHKINLVHAYALLGKTDLAWEMTNRIINEDNNYLALNPVMAMSRLDIEKAVQMALDDQDKMSQMRMDIIAVWNLYTRNIILHPDVQAYYVKQGKWINYLAKKFPEYKQYE